ncbi:type 1 fimbrial protein [Cupriavidus sp. 30B13]|uniref:type 1 fimbrial protein n=1 Tax=Cupriavidus sp. 30B13 TaxID=3384241 RepID=UPI003B8FC81A
MARRSIVSHYVLAASLLLSCATAGAQTGGTIRFSGTVVEPPCSFSASPGASNQMRFHASCPRPVAGKVAFTGASGLIPSHHVRFTHRTKSIGLPAISTARHSRLVAVITYR